MSAQTLTTGIVLLGVAGGGVLGWLQWLIVRRLVRRPDAGVSASVVAAAISTPLGTAMLLRTLEQAGLPPEGILPAGAVLLALHALLGTALVAVMAWTVRKR